MSACAVPLKLGITPWVRGARSAAALSEQAQRAEALGYESFWLPESHFGPEAIPDPLMLLAAVAAGTVSLRLGTTSYLLPLRHPLQAAEQVAVLDQLSDGRVVLGVGRGYAARTLQAFGVEPSLKRERFRSSLAAMIDAWRGAPLPELGDDCVVQPRPVQQPHPPVWVAAFGPLALGQAGGLGLPYLASPVEPLDVLAANYQRHAAAARAAGHPVPDVVPVMRALFVCGSASETHRVRSAVADAARGRGRPVSGPVEEWTIIGESGYVRERVAEYVERLGVTHLIAARLGVEGLDPERVEVSVASAPELLCG